MTCCLIIAYLVLIRWILGELPTILQLIRLLVQSKPVDIRERYGDWAVVTGASDGIGKAYCRHLAAKGINVVLIGRNIDKLQAVAQDLQQNFGITTKISVADFSNGREIYSGLREDLTNIDIGILVNNVGIQYKYPMAFAELPEDEIWDNVNVNISSATMMTRIVLPRMLAKNKGAIVNVSSSSGRQPMPFMNLYGASKAYITSFSEALREEIKNSAITVQTLAPLYVSSKINHFSTGLQRQSTFITDPDTFVESALACLGTVDHTRGFWPHRLQGFMFEVLPQWLRAKFLAIRYQKYHTSYINKLNRKKSLDKLT